MAIQNGAEESEALNTAVKALNHDPNSLNR